MMKELNLFSEIPASIPEEIFETILSTDRLKLERILSWGQRTPSGEWYDQEKNEWIVLLKGSAGLLFEGDREVSILHPGDYIHIPAHRRHRVDWTSEKEVTVWLALHF
jgi:cupin 2 domain-containing protein